LKQKAKAKGFLCWHQKGTVHRPLQLAGKKRSLARVNHRQQSLLAPSGQYDESREKGWLESRSERVLKRRLRELV